MRNRLGLLGVATLAVLAFSQATMAANTTVVVTPTNHQGWILDPALLVNNPAPWGFDGPGDSDGGNGSLRFGPITGANTQKYEAQPPEVNMLAADFESFAYDYQVITPNAGNPHVQFYANVYVDSSANGIGTTASFYDCRYGFFPLTGSSGWNTFSFSDNTTPNTSAKPLASCPSTIDALPSGSRILFFRLNGGDTGAGDTNLKGAYDLVAVSFSGNTTTYDFEPYAIATSKDQCKDGGWQNFKRADGSGFKNQGDCIQYVNTGK